LIGTRRSGDVLIIMRHDDPPTDAPLRPVRRGLSIVASVNAIAALAGGVALLTGGIDFGAILNERLPFASPTLAGIALIIVVALPLAVLAWAGWTRSGRTGDLALVAGVLLVGWILVQIMVLRAFSLFQPAYLAVAAYLIAASHRVHAGPGTRGALVVAAGAVAVAAGVGLLPHLVKNGLSPISVWAVVLVVAGLTAAVFGAHGALRGAGRAGKVAGTIVTVISVAGVAWLVAPAVAATRVAATSVSTKPRSMGLAYKSVTLVTSDDVRLAAWYLPSANRAAVVVLHGAGSTRSEVLGQAGALARAGYGVVLVDARGHGDSGGTAMDLGWYGDRDVAAGVDFLAARDEVDPTRIGVVGFSMGGEEAIGAAGADPRIRAVVAEGATGRQARDKTWFSEAYGWRGWLQEQFEKAQTQVTAYLSGASPPTPLRAAVASTHDTRFLLITAGNVVDEGHAAAAIRAIAPDRVSTWNIDGADHTDGYRDQPERWRRRVVGFLDERLRGAS
jgi:pimeloyl-ACP methyl ester carboxylesterase